LDFYNPKTLQGEEEEKIVIPKKPNSRFSIHSLKWGLRSAILKTSNSILKSVTRVNACFPILNLDGVPEETIYCRVKHMILFIIVFELILTSKYYLQKILNKPFSCDLNLDWKKFNEDVQKNAITMIEDYDCLGNCDKQGFLISKVMSYNFYGIFMINTYVSIYSYFGSNEANKKIMPKIMIMAIISGYVIGDAIFFTSKGYSQLFSGIFASLFFALYLFRGIHYFLMTMPWMILLIYSFPVCFFFEFVWPVIYNQNPNAYSKILPFVLMFLQYGYLKILSSFIVFRRHLAGTKMLTLAALYTFEFVNIGMLHRIVDLYGINAEIFENMSISLFLNLDKKILLTTSIWRKIRRTMVKKSYTEKYNTQIELSDYDQIFIEYRMEMELISQIIYLLILTHNFMDGCSFEICDCLGHPLANKTKFDRNHFILAGIMIGTTFLQYLIREVAVKLFKLKKFGRYPKLEGISLVYYFTLPYGCILHFGLESLYSMMVT